MSRRTAAAFLAAAGLLAVGSPGAAEPAADRPGGLSPKAARLLGLAESHWAYRPLADAPLPELTAAAESSVRDGIDRFILARLAAAGLSPSPEADRATYIRRVTLDLTGLPPAPEEVAAFVADPSDRAHERLVDRLLASPHYGERWGRHWLDLARYADSSGFHNDLDRPHAWKYRDYVIRSFNEDKPYGRFVAEQLAGDEVEGASEETLIATGFCRNGPSNDDNMGKTPAALAQYRADQLDDVISTASTVFLGVTIGCARCHDHKTDAFTARDYYSLLAIFNGTQKYGLVPGTEDAKGNKVPTDRAVQIQALVETSPQVPPTQVMRRGLASELGEEVPPAVPAVLARTVAAAPAFPPPAADAKTSGRRLALARWIASPDNALAWRVLANRVWQHHFGTGLVATPGDFGFTGEEPTHPELLDHLARHLVENGGRLKSLHKRIVLSATYRQSSAHREGAAAVDPANALLWRMNLRRMEAEVIRDGILAASGKLNRQPGGPGIKPRLRPDLIPASQRNKWPAIARENDRHWRRSVYIYAKRQLLMPMLELFDAPTTTDSCAARAESVVPTQALVLMNDEFVEEQAGYLARRAVAEAGDDPERAVRRLLALALSAEPAGDRVDEARRFVEARTAETGDRLAALTDLAHVVYNSNDFLYIR